MFPDSSVTSSRRRHHGNSPQSVALELEYPRPRGQDIVIDDKGDIRQWGHSLPADVAVILMRLTW
jgi:hypothetical protein